MDGRGEGELQRLFELATDLLAIADGQGHLTRSNPAWGAALGWSTDDLRTLAVDVVKIDRGFVAGLRDSPEDRAVVEAVLALARRLGVTVVAGGVETPAQDQILRELGCPVAQGFLYGRPVSAEVLGLGGAPVAVAARG